MKNKRIWLLGITLVSLIVALLGGVAPRPANAGWPSRDTVVIPDSLAYRSSLPNRTNQVHISEAYAKLPLSFEPNQGQTDGRVNFLARAGAHTLFLNATEAVLALPVVPVTKVGKHRGLFEPISPAGPPEESRPAVPAALRMRVVGANPRAAARGLEPLPGRVNYFIGNDPKRWTTDIPTHARVQYDDVYPGVDLTYYGHQGQLEYDFLVRAGADPSTITLSFSGAASMELDPNGDLVFRTASEELRHRKPRAFQDVNSVRREIPVQYVLRSGGHVGFQLGEYDENRPLVIDPVLVYSTYLGGSGFHDSGHNIDVDSTGNAYVTGATASVDYPTTAGSVQTTYGGGTFDVYVTKLNPSGSALVYSTFLGGSSLDSPSGIRVDASGHVYLAGGTDSSNFPTTLGSFQTIYGGGVQDAFVAKLSPDGSRLVYSTFLGGTGDDVAQDIDIDTSGNAYVAGGASSSFPITPGCFQTTFGGGFDDAFVTKLDPSGSGLVYSTFIGGSQRDTGLAIAVDASESASAYVSVRTSSAGLPTTPGSFQPSYVGGAVDAFLIKLAPSGCSRDYATYLGGTGDEDNIWDISLDAFGNAYLVGNTCSANFPTTAGSFQPTFAGGSCTWGDAFVAKMSPSGSALVYSTYLGGPGDDFGYGIAVDSSGAALVTGLTAGNFPILNAVQSAFGGGPFDAFVTKLNSAGSARSFSTYLGGLGDDGGSDLALHSSGYIYVYGNTNSTNFPTVNPLQPSNGGNYDPFVAKICDDSFVAAEVVQPINPDGSSVFKANRGVVPVKFTLNSNCVPTCNLPAATIGLTRTSGGTVGPVSESVYVNPADNGSNFRISDCKYIYNLATDSLGPGIYQVEIKIGGIVVGSAMFGLN